MRFRLLALAVLVPLVLTACISTTLPVGTPIDCETLATSLVASEPTLTTTPSGLKYRDTAPGAGATVAAGRYVAIHYSACLTSGVKFDQNTDVDTPLTFQVGDTTLIKGFNEGMIGMKVGGRRQLVIPPALAYGSAGVPPVIPPDATLVFTIDLLLAQ